MGRNLSTEAKARLDGAMVATYGDKDALTVPCTWCALVLDVVASEHERDRVVPGGPYSLDNVAPSCRPCNNERQDQTTGEWADDERAYPLVPLVTDKGTAQRIRTERGERIAREAREARERRAAVRARRRARGG
jgi:hypothetical protein